MYNNLLCSDVDFQFLLHHHHHHHHHLSYLPLLLPPPPPFLSCSVEWTCYGYLHMHLRFAVLRMEHYFHACPS